MPQEFTEEQFLRHLEALPGRIKAAEEEALIVGSREILTEIFSEIGHYQRSDTGPLPIWEELAESTKEDRVEEGYPENRPGERTHEMEHAYSVKAEGNKIVVENPLEKARDFELGTSKQPPRPVIGVALYRKGLEITLRAAQYACRVIGG